MPKKVIASKKKKKKYQTLLYTSIGPWTSSGLEVLGTFHGESSNDSLPNLQLMVSPLGISQDNGIAFKKQMGISTKVLSKNIIFVINIDAFYKDYFCRPMKSTFLIFLMKMR